MLVLIGASASGKTEIAKLLIKNYNFEKMITYTTRKPRLGEINHKDYHFINESTFKELDQQNTFLETTRYNNAYYATAFKDALKKRVVIVDINGANRLYEKLNNKVVIVYIQSPEILRAKRMALRGDDPYEIKQRLFTDQDTFHADKLNHIDNIIENNAQDLTDLAHHIAMFYEDRMN